MKKVFFLFLILVSSVAYAVELKSAGDNISQQFLRFYFVDNPVGNYNEARLYCEHDYTASLETHDVETKIKIDFYYSGDERGFSFGIMNMKEFYDFCTILEFLNSVATNKNMVEKIARSESVILGNFGSTEYSMQYFSEDDYFGIKFNSMTNVYHSFYISHTDLPAFIKSLKYIQEKHYQFVSEISETLVEKGGVPYTVR